VYRRALISTNFSRRASGCNKLSVAMCQACCSRPVVFRNRPRKRH